MAGNTNGNGDLGFEADLFKAADKLRGNLEPSEYKHVALGLIFLKYISDAFEAQRARLQQEQFADPEDPEEYLAARVFWVPEVARWSNLKANARNPSITLADGRKVDIGGLIDAAMEAIEAANPATLTGVLPKNYGSPALDKTMIGDLVMLFSDVGMHEAGQESRDLLGRAYEYFLSGFAGAEGRRGGEFFTPRSVVRVMVAMLEPYRGRVYDPCCGSGGMFVQSEKFIEEHGGRLGDISIYGQERNHTTWKLCKMNLAVRGIDADIKWNNEGSFIRDEFPNVKFDFALANPPFNVSDWWRESLAEDIRWSFGTPPQGNANYAWLILLFVNGLPLAMLELKNPGDENATLTAAFQQLETYKAQVPSLFRTNAVMVTSDGIKARIGSLTANEERYMPWRTVNGEDYAPPGTPELDTLLRGVFARENFLKLISDFTVFGDRGDGPFKIIAGYHQFHGAQKALKQAIDASRPGGDRKIGVIWHTQGSGKSFLMAFFAGLAVRSVELQNPTLLILTDRNDLDDQLHGTFSLCRDLVRQKPEQAESREDLKRLLDRSAGGVIFATVQKFSPLSGEEDYPLLCDRRNVIVIADEAHRTQYGFASRLDAKTGIRKYG